jgi:hypothetical protein
VKNIVAFAHLSTQTILSYQVDQFLRSQLNTEARCVL